MTNEVYNIFKEETDENIVRCWLMGLTQGATYPINDRFLAKVTTPRLNGNFEFIEAEWDEIIGACPYSKIDDPTLESNVKRIVDGLNGFIEKINNNPDEYFGATKGYYFTGKSDDGSYDFTSVVYGSQKECYEKMMDFAVNKMKWNVEWEDVIDGQHLVNGEDGIVRADEDENTPARGGYIGYEARFYPHKIVHTSYSGTYTFVIHRAKEGEKE